MSGLIVRDDLYRTFSDTPTDHTFYHGHTWSGNPIAAAAAAATLEIYEKDRIVQQADSAGQQLAQLLEPMRGQPGIRDVRTLGLIGVLELEPDASIPPRARRVQHRLRDRGCLLRPLGNVLYLMPPLNIQPRELEHMANLLCECVTAILNPA